ncbi:MAG: EI24 domain-containing protein [Cytophagales bacterium]|nr:EI24 domain-containing protein [Cytophagales bacterium]
MFSDFWSAVKAYGKAYRFIKEKKLRGFWLLTGLFCLMCYIALGIGLWGLSGWLSADLWELLPYAGQLNDFSPVFRQLFVFISSALGLLFYLLVYRYIILLFYVPVLALLSEYFHRWLPVEHRRISAFKEIWRGMVMSLRNLARELFFTFLLSALALFVPVSFPLVFVAIFLIECYYFGFSMLEYSKALSTRKIGDSVQFMSKHKGLGLGIGFVFNLMLYIPFVGALFFPFLALVAALLCMQEKGEHCSLSYDTIDG